MNADFDVRAVAVLGVLALVALCAACVSMARAAQIPETVHFTSRDGGTKLVGYQNVRPLDAYGALDFLRARAAPISSWSSTAAHTTPTTTPAKRSRAMKRIASRPGIR